MMFAMYKWIMDKLSLTKMALKLNQKFFQYRKFVPGLLVDILLD